MTTATVRRVATRPVAVEVPMTQPVDRFGVGTLYR